MMGININGSQSYDLNFENYMRIQIEKILSPFNRWVTGEKVGHNPTDNELAMNFIECGGAEAHENEHENEMRNSCL